MRDNTEARLDAVLRSIERPVPAGGAAALHAAVASCAPGVTVMNIDNGYCAALRILPLVADLRQTEAALASARSVTP